MLYITMIWQLELDVFVHVYVYSVVYKNTCASVPCINTLLCLCFALWGDEKEPECTECVY